MGRYRAGNREVYTWTELDKSTGNFARQSGLLLGIEKIKTPLRLSLTPYAAVSGEHYPFNETGKSNFSTSYRGGMDLKYGINESFTLDMTLIPDYGQVQSDNIVLNLSPFEVRYDEHRPFFTEGTQLLQKAGLFYSRRVGSKPARYDDVAYGSVLEAGEQLIKNPDETQLLNATKITGQTVSGIGLGFFNALTAPMYAVIRDSLGHEREYLTNPLTNYNLVVVGKNLNNGSDISIANTNVQRFAGDDPGQDYSERPKLKSQVITGPFRIADLEWIPLELRHGTETILGFRFGRVAYCTDCSAIPSETMEQLLDLDILILDALRYTPHPTHFNVEQALKVSQRIAAKQTYLTHIAHEIRHAELEHRLPESIHLAYDGLQLILE
jgi:hypothetical protein